MTPESLGRELADILADRSEVFELRGDPCETLAILDATRHIASVQLAGGAVIAVPYGVAPPVIGHRYLVESTPRGDKWLKIPARSWCKTWTYTTGSTDTFNEAGATAADDLIFPAGFDQLQLRVKGPVTGDGHDGAATGGLGVVNLNTSSIVGRSQPDALLASPGQMSDTDRTYIGMAGSTGFAVGDEFLLITLQGNSPSAAVNSGNYEFFRIASIDVDGLGPGVDKWTTDNPRSKWYGAGADTDQPSVGGDIAFQFIQRVPNYSDTSSPGTGLSCSPWGSADGIGVIAIRTQSGISWVTACPGGAGFRGGPATVDCTPGQGYVRTGESLAGFGQWAGTRSLGAGGGGLRYYDYCGISGGDWSGAGGGAGHANAGSDGGLRATESRGGQGGDPYGSPDLTETIFLGSGGGGGSLNKSLSERPDLSPGIEAGGRGGGIIYIGCASFNGRTKVDAGDLPAHNSGGGSGGSTLVECAGAATVGGATGVDTTFNAAGHVGGSGVHNWSDVNPSHSSDSVGGDGSGGRVMLRSGSYTDLGLDPVTNAGSYVHETLTYPHYVGCWSSAIYDSAMLGLASGLSLFPTSALIDWTADSDGEPCVFHLEGGEEADLSDAVRYPAVGEIEAVSGAEVELGPYLTTGHLYWRLTVCLDSGTGSDDTPTVQDIQLCGVGV